MDDFKGYASRALDLVGLADSVPQTAPMPLMPSGVPAQPRLSMILRQIAEVIELQEAGDIARDNALSIVSSLPDPLAKALAVMLGSGEDDGEDKDDVEDGEGD